MALTKIGKEGISNISNSSDATAITIDSSENVLVAKTATNYQTVGVEAKSTGQLWATADGNNPILAVRKSSDGKIQTFYKDTTEVGNIGAVDGDLYLGTGSKGIRFIDANSAIIPADPSASGATNTNAIDLGASFGRYKDLYLSGNVYLGGTGSANAFDDYEEGAWTPTLFNGSSALGSADINATYTKIGRMVYLEFRIQRDDTSSDTNTIQIGGLPFSSRAGFRVAGQAWIDNSSSDIRCFIYLGSSTTTATLIKAGDTDSFPSFNELQHARYVLGQIIYNTA